MSSINASNTGCRLSARMPPPVRSSPPFAGFGERQHDAFTELINLGCGRAAAALSALTGRGVTITPPSLHVTEANRVSERLPLRRGDTVVAVVQPFHGPVGGQAMLVLERAAAVTVLRLLDAESDGLDSAARENLREVGNILLNHCLGVFDNLLGTPLRLPVPGTWTGSVEELPRAFDQGNAAADPAILVQTQFIARGTSLACHIVLLPSTATLGALLQTLEAWESVLAGGRDAERHTGPGR